MNFFTNVKNSLYNPSFYERLKSERLIISFRYFFSLIGLVSLAMAFVFGLKISPFFTTENLRMIVNYYPAELEIKTSKGVISTNVEEPYMIKDTFESNARDRYVHVVVIDTKNEFTPDLFRDYDTRVLIGRNFVVTSKNQGHFEFNDLSNIPDFSLSRAKLLRWAGLVGDYHLAISLFIFIGVFLAVFAFFSTKLLIFLLVALIVMGLAKLKKAEFSYKNSYRLCLHLATVPIILQSIFILSGIAAPFPFFFTILLLAIAFFNISQSTAKND